MQQRTMKSMAYAAAVAAAAPMSEVSRKLHECSNAVRYPSTFPPNAIVTAREDFSYVGKGLPHIVIEHRREGHRLKPNRNGFGSAAYGKITDLLLGRIVEDGSFQTFWVEGYAFERWNEDKHGASFDADAKKAADNLPALRKALGIEDEPASASTDRSSTDDESMDEDEGSDDGSDESDEPVPQPYAPVTPSDPAAAPVEEPARSEPTAPLTPEVPFAEPGAAPADDGLSATATPAPAAPPATAPTASDQEPDAPTDVTPVQEPANNPAQSAN